MQRGLLGRQASCYVIRHDTRGSNSTDVCIRYAPMLIVRGFIEMILCSGLYIVGSAQWSDWPGFVKDSTDTESVNSLALGKFEWNFRYVIFKWILVTDGWGISCEIALIVMSLDLTDHQSTLVQVMAWCRQATSHYLSLCWPRSLSPYGVTGPQWVKMN